MKATEAYMEFCALKAHFDRPKYDYFKYNGKTRVGDLEKNRGKTHFFRLSRTYNKQQLRRFYIANFLAGNTWVGSMTKDVYIEWKRHMAHLMEDYKKDLRAIRQLADERHLDMSEIFKIAPTDPESRSDGAFVEHPILFRLLLGGHVSIETVILLASLINFKPSYDRKLKDDPIWEEWSRKIDKYTPFVMLEMGKNIEYRKYVVEILIKKGD